MQEASAPNMRKLRQILAILHAAEIVDALWLPTFGLHPLKAISKAFEP